MEQLHLNERFLKLGKFPILETIPVDGSIQIKLLGYEDAVWFDCVKTEKKSNQDGTYDEIYVMKWRPT